MPNNTDPAREAAWNQSPTYYRICDGNEPDPCRAEADWKSGYDAGAAREDWVAVEERLPHKAGDYLVTHVNGFVQEIEWRVEPRRGGRWITEFGDLSVTAWMPKPKPYGGKDE